MSQTLTPQQLAQLEKLNDISLPADVSWWPLATGWWILLGGMIVVTLIIIVYRQQQKRSLQKLALMQCQQIEANQKNLTNSQLAAELSALLKRVTIQLEGQKKGALNGQQWIDYLLTGKHSLSKDVAHFLAYAPYQPDTPQADLTQQAIQQTRQWIRRKA